MMTEDYVSFETAKLLKEKGFNGEYHMYYVEGGKFKCDNLRDIKDYAKSIIEFNYLHNTKVPDPTLQMTMKWLREVHNIDCTPYLQLNARAYTYMVVQIKPINVLKVCNENYKSYEEACEAAIKYCLENII